MRDMIDNDDDWALSKEAFPLRHEIKDPSPPPEQFPNHPPDLNEDSASVVVEDQPCQLVVSAIPKPLPWDPTRLIVEALNHHADIRDVQTSASILIALGEKRKDLNIDIATQEHWLMEYLDMLCKFKLWHVATQVRSRLILNVYLFRRDSTFFSSPSLSLGFAMSRGKELFKKIPSLLFAQCEMLDSLKT